MPKCLYFQEDHWRGSVVQSDQQTVVYEFVGHYFFNKATGDGGAWVTGFTLAGQTFDPRSLPGFPPQYDQYFGPGTGGFITHDDLPTDRNCVTQASQSSGSVYANHNSRCLSAQGAVTRHGFASLRLGAAELVCGSVSARPNRRRATSCGVALLLTTGDGFSLTGRDQQTIAAGRTAARLHRAFPRSRRILRIRHGSVFAVPPAGQNINGTIVVGLSTGAWPIWPPTTPTGSGTHPRSPPGSGEPSDRARSPRAA